MKRKTTTAQINEALTNDLLIITKAECYHKTSRQTNVINPESFIDDFQFLCESGIFADCVGWHYQKDYKTNQYIAEAGRTDAYSENIATVHMRVNEGVKIEDIEKVLLMKKED